jgi:hypothetical protein
MIIIMTGIKRRVSCRELFKKFNIHPLVSEFLLPLLLLVVINMDNFQTNSDIHNIYVRDTDIHGPTTNLSKYQKGVYCTGIKLFNNLPPTIKCLTRDIKLFKPV